MIGTGAAGDSLYHPESDSPDSDPWTDGSYGGYSIEPDELRKGRWQVWSRKHGDVILTGVTKWVAKREIKLMVQEDIREQGKQESGHRPDHIGQWFV